MSSIAPRTEVTMVHNTLVHYHIMNEVTMAVSIPVSISRGKLSQGKGEVRLMLEVNKVGTVLSVLSDMR